jgi:hypothetical protein
MARIRLKCSVNGSPLTKDIDADEHCAIDAEVSRLKRNAEAAGASFHFDGWNKVEKEQPSRLRITYTLTTDHHYDFIGNNTSDLSAAVEKMAAHAEVMGFRFEYQSWYLLDEEDAKG